MTYLSFIKQNYRFLAFGFLLVFVGNYGQTFFISIFGGVWREAFALNHTQYSAYYSLATLISGLVLMFIGGKLDSSSLKAFTLWVVAGTLVATLVLASAVHAWMLFAGFLLIRFCGQGLCGHTAFTSMARYFDKNRGKAISVAAMGMPIGEFILPLAGAALIVSLGWRETWFLLAALLMLVFLPLLWWSMGDERVSHPVTSSSNEHDEQSDQQHWQRREVIRDWRFWLIIPAILSPAVLITGLFFHQAFWAEARGWSLAWIASSMTVYAVSHAIGSLYTGSLVDLWGARRVMRLYLLPLALGVGVLMFDSFSAWLIFMFLSGLSVGASGPAVGSLWPEVYGTRHLGSIRAMVSALMVVSTAIAPVVIGAMIDHGIAVTFIMMCLTLYSLLSVIICQSVFQKST